MSKFLFTSVEYRKLQSEITKRNWESGKYDFLRKPKDERLCKGLNCIKTFIVFPSDPQKFCSHLCADTFRRERNLLREIKCLACDKNLKTGCYKFCSNECQRVYQHREFIKNWKSGKDSGETGIVALATSVHIRKYLFIKYDEKCSICGWSKRNPSTNKVPLEVDHIDGNSKNNLEDNLRLVCPNCHSLSPNYKNLNRGKGRVWRMKKYIKNSGTKNNHID